MPNKCKDCGSTEHYNSAINDGLCNVCIALRLDEYADLVAEVERLKKAVKWYKGNLDRRNRNQLQRLNEQAEALTGKEAGK